MAKRSIQFIAPDRSRQLTELAERARLSLSRFAGVEVDYNAVGLQMLDEWIERHLRQFPNPSNEILLIWSTFLGETFRRRYNGEWGVNTLPRGPQLGIVCPRSASGLLFIDVMEQVQRRVRDGIAESLAFYYTLKGVEIKSE